MSAQDLGTRRPAEIWALGFAALLVALNLRPAMTSVGPLLSEIAAGSGIGAVGAAWLTTVPALCLGLGSGLAALVGGRVGIDRGILVGLAMLALGLATRGISDAVPLFAGTVLACLGIGVTGTLLPALIKRDFSSRAGRLTGLYTTVLCLGAALGTALSVPLHDALAAGWAMALAAWALPALLATLAWLPFSRAPTAASPRAKTSLTGLFGDPLAWQVTGFMGLQSSLAYTQFGWLPAVLAGRGLSAAEAGYYAALFTLAQAPGALLVGQFATRSRDQRGWIVCMILAALTGFTAVAFGPGWLMIPAGVLLGTASGATFSLGLIVIVLRARDAADAGTLSAMAQGIGYSLASLGPLGFGLAHDVESGWRLPMTLFAALGLGALVCGLGAGRDRHVGARAYRENPARRQTARG